MLDPRVSRVREPPMVEKIPLKIRVRDGLGAFFLTLFTCGINLFFVSQRNLWKEVFTGKRIIPKESSGTSTEVVAKRTLHLCETKAPSDTPPMLGTSKMSEEEKSISSVQENPSSPLHRIDSSTVLADQELCDKIDSSLSYDAHPTNAIDFFEKKTEVEGKSIRLVGTSLCECHCFASVDRSASAYRLNPRVQLEKQLTLKIKEMIQLGKIDKSKPLLLCSLGPGGLLEELIIHANLAKLGLEIHWILIEPYYFEQSSVKKNMAPLADFYSYASALSSKHKAPPPRFYAVNGSLHCTQGLIDQLRSHTPNPFVWLAIDADEMGEAIRQADLMRTIPQTDLRAVLRGRLRINANERDLETNFSQI